MSLWSNQHMALHSLDPHKMKNTIIYCLDPQYYITDLPFCISNSTEIPFWNTKIEVSILHLFEVFSLITQRITMISPKKLMKMARKWQKVVAMKRKRISLPRADLVLDADCCSTSVVADKGHFVVYSSDRRRFVIPLAYLNNEIFTELLQMSEEEFGIQSEGPIILPCDSALMDYAISFIQHGVAKDLERALIMSITSSNCSSSAYFHQGQSNEPLLLHAFWRNHTFF